MNSYKKTYNILKESISESREKIDSANNELILLRKELWKIANEISDKKRELNNLNYKRNQIVSRKDKLISIPMTLLTILVEVALVYAGYNIVMIPQEILSKIIVGLLTFSLGGCTCLGIALVSKNIIAEMENRLQKKIAQNSSKCQKVSEEIENKKNSILQLNKKFQSVQIIIETKHQQTEFSDT